MKKAVFLDKDGTLIPDIPYNTDPHLISLQPGTVEGLKRLQEEGYLFIIISNQAGVARGYFDEDALIGVKEKMYELFVEHQLTLSGFYYCPHYPEGKINGYNIDCTCRKPKPGMILKAAADHNINISSSWMVGDILNDVEAGNRAGCKTILIDNDNETEWIINEYRKPTFTVKTINEAADSILNSLKTSEEHEYSIS